MSKLRLPAEWEPQSAIWMVWPWATHLWPENRNRIKHRFAALIVEISKITHINLVCPNEHQNDAQKHIFNGCALLNNISFIDIITDDVWCRDYAPLFTINNTEELHLTNWKFNAWGGKYPFKNDNAFNTNLLNTTKAQSTSSKLILEGGAIDVNGYGQLLTTEDVILNSNRNPQYSKSDYESEFRKLLGVTQTIWLKKGLLNDDTDGHIDNIARFVSKDKVLLASCDKTSANFPLLQENKAILEKTYVDKKAIQVIELPLPDPIFFNGKQLPANYLNFLITNDVILLPSYKQEIKDEQAKTIVQQCFPQYTVTSFDCSDFLQEGGAIHCLTMNQPRSK